MTVFSAGGPAANSIVECDPRLQALPEIGWRYTARPEWSSPGESIWMRLSKFSFCNRMSVAEIARLFAADDGTAGTATMDLRIAVRWDLAALAKFMETSPRDVLDAFCVSLPGANVSQAATELRYCPSCLASGFHGTWFQWHHVERCPVHDLALRGGCSQCDHPIAYALGRPLALSPLCCVHCRRDWVPSLARPAGRCEPLSAQAAALMRRWAAFARDVVKAPGSRNRHWSTGRYAASQQARPPARPHLLTMVNRLFDSPLPPLRVLTGQASGRRCPALPRVPVLMSEAAGQSVGDHRPSWPHFTPSFFRHEQTLRAARSWLFAYFSPSWTAFQADRGRGFSVIVDGVSV
ncbi:MAG: hypothetical protein L6Q69_01595 [Zoogloea sp.]|nr:hypothetical protein [Zoogloea sp.]